MRQPVCPICLGAILPTDDVIVLGCAGRRPGSAPHQMHCTPCGHAWLGHASLAASHPCTPSHDPPDGQACALAGAQRAALQCPICRDARPNLNSMRPGGAYAVGPRVFRVAP